MDPLVDQPNRAIGEEGSEAIAHRAAQPGQRAAAGNGRSSGLVQGTASAASTTMIVLLVPSVISAS